MDICRLILDDHAELRRLFAMIDDIDRSDTVALAAIWHRLGTMLDTHAEAEERFFYPSVVQHGTGAGDAKDLDDEVGDAIEDHNDIRDAVKAVDGETVGSDKWFDAVAKANEANSDHLAEEERQALTDMRRHLSLDERHRLGVLFATFDVANIDGVEPVDKDAKRYMKEHQS